MAELVVGAGAVSWDAGTDLFLDVARRLADDTTVELWWVGRRSRGAARRLELDVELLGLRDRILWADELPPSVTPTVLVVPARAVSSRDEVLGSCDGAVACICFSLPNSGLPDVAAVPEVVSYPDTRTMAARVRSILEEAMTR